MCGVEWVPSNHYSIQRQLVSVGSLVRVWRVPPLPVPGPLVLISQVDEHISSSPNPSSWIPAHMSGIHTNRHVCIHFCKYSWSQIHTYTGAMSTWQCGRSMQEKHAPREGERRVITHNHTHTMNMMCINLGFNTSQIVLHISSCPASAPHKHLHCRTLLSTHLQIIPCHWLRVVGLL